MARPNQIRLALFIITISILFTTRRVNSYHTDDRAPFLPGVVAYWPMTLESQGLDLSGNGNNATFVGLDYTDGPVGKPNRAVNFHGNPNSYVWVNNSLSMQVGKYPGFSFTGFFRPHHTESASLIDWWSKRGVDAVFILSFTEKYILLRLSPRDADIQHNVKFSNMKLTNGSWQFFGISYSKTTGMVTAFLDGVQDQKTIGKNIIAGTDMSSKVGIGRHLYFGDEFNYKGDMSCMMLFQVALTADGFERVKRFCNTGTSTRTTLPDIAVSNIATTRAIASWTESPGTFSGYKITLERKRSKLDLESVHPPFISSSVTFPRSVLSYLVPGATYRVRVWHMHGNIVGRARSSKWFNAKLYRPPVVESHSIDFSNITAISAVVSWKNLTGKFDGYSVDICPSTKGGARADPSTVPRGMNATSLKNLSPGTHYTVEIRVQIGKKLTFPSTRSFQTREIAPVAYESINIFMMTATSANVSWKEVTGSVDGYSVNIIPTTGGANANPSTVPSESTTTSLKNLSPGSFYIITIRTKIGSKMSLPSMQSFRTLDPPTTYSPSFQTIAVIALVIALISPAVTWVVVIVLMRKTFCVDEKTSAKQDRGQISLENICGRNPFHTQVSREEEDEEVHL